MKRWAAVVIGLGMIVGTAVVAPAATAGTGLIATKGQPVIAMSDRTTCAVRETHRVYCWGANAQGELGRSDLATTQTVAPVNGVYDAIAVYGATTYSGEGGGFCALRINRTLVCWGDSESYRFGDGMWAAHDDATVISGMTNVATMSMGAAVTCVAKQDGTVWCVGGSSLVLPPAGSTTYRKIAGATSATAVAVGANFACFLKVDRTVWCWGTNNFGQLGDGTGLNSVSTPVKVKGVSDATAIVAGADHACALRSGGTAVCWGYNGALQLGHVPLPSVDFSLVPVMVSNLSGVTSLAASPFPSCATTATVVKCWGEGGNYQLGDTQTNDQPAPATAVVGLDKPTMVAVGATSTCEVASGNRVYCWGLNLAGEVGNGTNSAAPNGAGPWEKFGFALSPRVVPILNSAPGKPSGSSPSAGRIKISWAAPSTSNGTSAPKDYVIQYRLKGTSTWKTFKDSVSTSRTVTVTGLSRGKYYQFRVQPKNWAGAGTASAASGYIKSK